MIDKFKNDYFSMNLKDNRKQEKICESAPVFNILI